MTLLPLSSWAQAMFGEKPPCNRTLQRWVRKGLIQPAPVKIEGRYFVASDAQVYTADAPPNLEEIVRANRQKAHARQLA